MSPLCTTAPAAVAASDTLRHPASQHRSTANLPRPAPALRQPLRPLATRPTPSTGIPDYCLAPVVGLSPTRLPPITQLSAPATAAHGGATPLALAPQLAHDTTGPRPRELVNTLPLHHTVRHTARGQP